VYTRKNTQNRSRKPHACATTALQLVHTDLAGPTGRFYRGLQVHYCVYRLFRCYMCAKSKSDTVVATERFSADTAPFGDVNLNQIR